MTTHLPATVIASELPVRVFLPSTRTEVTPLVLIHGNRRRAGAMMHAFLPLAMEAGIPLIVPRFGRPQFDAYQSLSGSRGPGSAADALLATLDSLSHDRHLDCSRIDLLGWSGGAQFGHRFALVAPSRVRRLISVSAGWYTWLDPDRAFPRGTAEDSALGPFDTDSFLRIRHMVAVGDSDTTADSSLRQSPWVVRQQGADRVARALAWLDHLEAVAQQRSVDLDARFDLLPSTGHSWSDAVGVGGLVPRSLHFLLKGDPE